MLKSLFAASVRQAATSPVPPHIPHAPAPHARAVLERVIFRGKAQPGYADSADSFEEIHEATQQALDWVNATAGIEVESINTVPADGRAVFVVVWYRRSL